MADAAELEELELELELEVAVELLSLEDEEVLVEEDEEEVPEAVELEATPLAPALPVGVRPVDTAVAPVATMVDWVKVEPAPTPPVAVAVAELTSPLLTPPLARTDIGEAATRANTASCLKPYILAVVAF